MAFTGQYLPYPFWVPGFGAVGTWYDWNTNSPLEVTFPSNLPIASIWIPIITTPVSYYNGTGTSGPPQYVTQSSGSELIPVTNGQTAITLYAAANTTMEVYVSSAFYSPFRLGTVGNQVTSVTATLPITSTGGSTPNIMLVTPLAVPYGGTGTASPAGVVAGTGIGVSGLFPDQTVSVTGSYVGSITVDSPLASTGGTSPTLSLTTVPLTLGGTGQMAPALVGATTTLPAGITAGAGICVNGIFATPGTAGSGNTWTISNIGVLTETGTVSGPPPIGALYGNIVWQVDPTNPNLNIQIKSIVAGGIPYMRYACTNPNVVTFLGSAQPFSEVVVHGGFATSTTSGSYYSHAVSFPNGFSFTGVPDIIMTPASTTPSTSLAWGYGGLGSGPTYGGFTAYSTVSGQDFSYIAMGPA
jgi:hypothetical protein